MSYSYAANRIFVRNRLNIFVSRFEENLVHETVMMNAAEEESHVTDKKKIKNHKFKNAQIVQLEGITKKRHSKSNKRMKKQYRLPLMRTVNNEFFGRDVPQQNDLDSDQSRMPEKTSADGNLHAPNDMYSDRTRREVKISADGKRLFVTIYRCLRVPH